MATIVPGTFSNNLSTSIGSTSAGDTIIIQDSSAAFTSGLDLSGTEYEAFYVSPSCRSDFGSNGGGVMLDLDGDTYTGYLEYNGRGKVAYFDPTNEIVETKIVDTGSGTFYGMGGTWTLVSQGGGKSQFNDSADVVAAHVEDGSCYIDEHASQAVDTLTVGPNANVIVKRTIGAATVSGTLNMPERSVTGTTLTLLPGAHVVWAGGNITNVVRHPGTTLDLSMASQSITITNSTKHADSAKVIKPSGGFTLTTTNETLYGSASSDK